HVVLKGQRNLLQVPCHDGRDSVSNERIKIGPVTIRGRVAMAPITEDYMVHTWMRARTAFEVVSERVTATTVALACGVDILHTADVIGGCLDLADAARELTLLPEMG